MMYFGWFREKSADKKPVEWVRGAIQPTEAF